MLNLAYDLGTTLDIIAGVRLGPGQISVHPTKLAVAGHGFGAAAAVFAAAGLAGTGPGCTRRRRRRCFPRSPSRRPSSRRPA